ncbi:periplasmic heavy metal sensor [uncultured Desulfosarcina sp.]|uniref:periplasmic heavy metal sensor n=1 Tax=uncultured Desulfosarcina sp. TaxID=218289 RepID=UPI0029C820D1|nr:periplasmic heavy metal sensor [uncultured Desulfosarcina sp.]
MTLSQKRLLVFFSIALNVGFVVMAIVMVLHHPKPFRERSWQELVNIVQELNLPAEQEDAVMANMRQFRETMDGYERDLKQARGDIVRYLANDGPIDENQLHRLIETAQSREKRKSDAFEAHVIEQRSLLGNEKGAQFFSLLQAHLESRKSNAKR